MSLPYDLQEETEVRLAVLDVLGQIVEGLVTGRQSIGTHTLRWEAKNLPGGVYFVRLETNNFVQTRAIVLSK